MIDDYATTWLSRFVENYKQENDVPLWEHCRKTGMWREKDAGIRKSGNPHPKHWMLFAFLTRL
jgi:hypothetical protein